VILDFPLLQGSFKGAAEYTPALFIRGILLGYQLVLLEGWSSASRWSRFENFERHNSKVLPSFEHRNIRPM